jgi:hypothetical protein
MEWEAATHIIYNEENVPTKENTAESGKMSITFLIKEH